MSNHEFLFKLPVLQWLAASAPGQYVFSHLDKKSVGGLLLALFVATGGRVSCAESSLTKKRCLQVTAPWWFKNLLLLIHVPSIWLCVALHSCCRKALQHRCNNSMPSLSLNADDLGTLQNRLIQAYTSGAVIEKEQWCFKELLALFDSLPAIKAEDLRHSGTWRGRFLRADRGFLHWVGLPWTIMTCLGTWWGKRFQSQFNVEPAVFNVCGRLLLPYSILGGASLHDMEFRGKTSTGMIYDHAPFHDHFRVLRENDKDGHEHRMLLGLMTTDGFITGFFTMEVSPSFDDYVISSHIFCKNVCVCESGTGLALTTIGPNVKMFM